MTEPTTSDDRTWAMAAHLLGAVGWLSYGILSWLGPLAIYFLKREQSRFVAFHALQSLFFQLASMAIIWVAGVIIYALCFLLIGFFLLPILFALPVVPIIWAIVAGLKANAGEWYEYPVVGQWARRNLAV
jgi:uncharacterized Tic20 family protein